MVRLFAALCKIKLKELSDDAIFQDATKSFRHHSEKCPSCGAVGLLSPNGCYMRNLVTYRDGRIIGSRISVDLFKCASCGASHALLPDILVPYSPYSLRFKLTVLLAYFERKTTVAAVCEHFGIAVSTLYEWKKIFLSHKELFLGVIASLKEPALDFLKHLFGSDCLSDRLHSFFRRHAFSFMQNHKTARSRPP